ncbi:MULTISPECIES: MFS transporter [Streptomyces]|uniref:MFS transporter n=2 Tax=Streptomyces rimosus subsp. rimosus TaxID=132474 RepID=L8EKY8_STRR1|nr:MULTISPECIES: MFS transporter [Streptomyces]KOG77272.1 MFS transporter [Kitasatospora aureofaciens]MYT44782.1 MFS transporter [Streptomyces sp. SID5471]KEF05667.1 MFS transporter [Streptomyces rimosus]KOT35110.1 MFS transporter [Streptomyces rimosus subsp. rimosus]KOT45334.1 MFS transporter [Streptomyces sp. NRRL WC-3701]
MATLTGIRPRALVRASGGPRYAVALAVDALGTGLLRPFLLLYGVTVLRLSAPVTGIAMTAGIVTGLVCMPAVGRWLDRGARSTVVAASMLVRVLGVALLLAAPAGHMWLFAAAALFLGVGNQAWPAAHAALVATVAHGRERDTALAWAHALRNAALGIGALLATVCLAGGTTALRALAAVTALAYLAAAVLAWSVHVHAHPAGAAPARDQGDRAAPRMSALLAANVVYVFCLNVPEIALPLVLVTQLHASPVWPAAVFVANTVLVVTLQVPVTVLMSRFSRRTVLALSGVVLAASYAGFLAATSLGHGWAVPAVAMVSVVCTIGEIIYAGSATALVTALAPAHALGRALARLQLSTGFGLAVSPAVITALAPLGPVALWGSVAAATLLSASAVATEKDRGAQPSSHDPRRGASL